MQLCIRNSFSSAMIVLYVATAFIVTGIGQTAVAQDREEWAKIVSQYRDESVASSNADSGTVKQDLYSRWFNRFLQVAAKTEDRRVRLGALQHAISLANGMEKYEVSFELSRRLTTESKDWRDQLRWLTEAGEVAHLAYVKSKEQKYLEASRESFSQAYKLTVAHREAVAESIPLAKDGLVSSYQYAELIKSDGEKQNLLSAANIYAETDSILAASTEGVRSVLGGIGFTRLLSCEREMVAAAAAGELDRSYQVLDKVVKGELGPKAPSELFANIMHAAFPHGGEKYWREAEKWLDTSPTDEYTPYIIYDLAQDYYEKAVFLKAIALYEQLLADYQSVLIERDREMRGGAVIDSEGHLSFVMFNLAQAYAQLEHWERAEELLRRFVKLYPKDARVGLASRHLERLSSHNAKVNDARMKAIGMDAGATSREKATTASQAEQVEQQVMDDDSFAFPKSKESSLWPYVLCVGAAIVGLCIYMIIRSRKLGRLKRSQ